MACEAAMDEGQATDSADTTGIATKAAAARCTTFPTRDTPSNDVHTPGSFRSVARVLPWSASTAFGPMQANSPHHKRRFFRAPRRVRATVTILVFAALFFCGAASALNSVGGPASTGSARGRSSRLITHIQGAYPSNYMPNGDGSVSFNTFSTDGNHYVLHVLDVAGHDQTYGFFKTSVVPVAANRTYVVGAIRNKFIVYRRSTGRLMAQRKIKGLYAPDIPHLAWIKGDRLAVVSHVAWRCSSTVTFLKLPALTRIETVPLPFFG